MTAESGGDEAILPSEEEVLACQFSSWYPTFSALPEDQKYRGRSNVTIKSTIIHLPANFEEYLDTDQLILPAESHTSSALLEHHDKIDPEWSSDDDENDNGEQEEEQLQRFSFLELNQQIEQAIVELGGAVMPKLNWSSPRDAVWVNSGTLECRTSGDVYLLLKASDFCNHDVHHAVHPRPPLQLALRKWCNLFPSQEFRCFVFGRRLLAISQRRHSQHWPHLMEQQREIAVLLQEFFEMAVRDRVALSNMVFDVYVDKKQRVWLLDINVWASRTDALLFEWRELSRMAAASIDDNRHEQKHNLPVVRVVETEKQVRADPLASYKAPIDTLHVASAMSGCGGGSKFREFMDLCKRPGSSDNTSSEEEADGEMA